MANQRIYKNIGWRDESTWGVSASGTNKVMQVVSSTLGLNPNKELVEDTVTNIRGRDRMTIGRNEIDGDIMAYADPRNINIALEWVNGVQGSGVTLGTSAFVYTYFQNTDGNYISRTINQDRNNSQEAFYGVRASKLSIDWSDKLMELTLSLMAKSRGTGVSLVDTVGSTVKPFEFADITVSVGGPGYTNAATILTSSGTIEYDNGMERTFLSGSRDAARTDGNIPTLSGTLEFFHDGTSFISPTFGVSELYIRIEATTTAAHGLISGVTPHYLRINIPRAQFTTNVRPYEQAGLAKETITFQAMYDYGNSALWVPQLTTGFDIEN